MFSMKATYGKTPEARNAERTALIVEALAEAETALKRMLDGVAMLKAGVQDAETFGGEAVDNSIKWGRADYIGRDLEGTDRRLRDYMDATRLVALYAGGYETTEAGE